MDFRIILFFIGVHEICLEEELVQDLITQDILEVYQKVFLKQALELILLPEVIVAIHVLMRK